MDAAGRSRHDGISSTAAGRDGWALGHAILSALDEQSRSSFLRPARWRHQLLDMLPIVLNDRADSHAGIVVSGQQFQFYFVSVIALAKTLLRLRTSHLLADRADLSYGRGLIRQMGSVR